MWAADILLLPLQASYATLRRREIFLDAGQEGKKICSEPITCEVCT